MINSIGDTAGKVYRALEMNGELTLAKLKTITSTDSFELNAAVGWLAREDKVVITKAGKAVKIGLK